MLLHRKCNYRIFPSRFGVSSASISLYLARWKFSRVFTSRMREKLSDPSEYYWVLLKEKLLFFLVHEKNSDSVWESKQRMRQKLKWFFPDLHGKWFLLLLMIPMNWPVYQKPIMIEYRWDKSTRGNAATICLLWHLISQVWSSIWIWEGPRGLISFNGSMFLVRSIWEYDPNFLSWQDCDW